ncbi:nitrous oxide reductase family maturation protein NosD [Natronorubrum sp. DTA28]|uniref:nitrous oxide reductase family maturation protein NosD n=1 Tax=Natronorubrum sp. DTA28 TaxID=3447019 RepID=UPI003F867803
MSPQLTEGWFAALAAAMLIASLAGAGFAASADTGSASDAVAVTPDVPDPHGVEEPDEPGVATVDGEAFDSLQSAVDAADPGETIVLEGRFDEHVVLETPELTLEATDPDAAVLDGGGEGTVLEIGAENATVDGLWIRDSGLDRSGEHAGVRVAETAAGATVSDVRITDVSHGVWIDGATGVTVEDSVIAGHADVTPRTDRGNGIHLWEADDALLRNNAITETRDGIFYQWAENVVTEDNVLWNVRYGVHYMYSDDNRLEGNVAFDNDVGFALMVSAGLEIVDNAAINNRGSSAHGILVKDIDRSEIRGNDVVGNGNGFYVYNAQNNELTDNLVLGNDLGISVTAGTSGELVAGNSFVDNDLQAYASENVQVAWNESERGNYWSDASVVDLDGDGSSEIRHQPAGAVERLVHEQPQAAVFADSPAFDAVRLAESSFPVLETGGVVDHRPLAEPPHDDWRDYYATHDH